MGSMEDRLERIEDKIDENSRKLDSLALSVEHRVTKLETKAGIFGLIGGLIGGMLSAFRAH